MVARRRSHAPRRRWNADRRTADDRDLVKDYAAILDGYARDVVEGRIVACKWTRLACQRQIDDRKRAEADPAWPYEWDEWHVEDVCAFVELMPHIEGEWNSPTIVLEPWQVFILGCVFGWRRKVDGHRRFNTVYQEVARKNAKSAIASCIALYCLTCEGERGPQIKTAATTGDQARIIFDISKKMAERTPKFRASFGVHCYARSIACSQNAGTIKPINAKASTQDGLNPHLAILDELHAHKDRALFDVLKSARGARKNPLSWYVTTAGYNAQGVCYEQRTFGTKVLEGVFEADHYFVIIYTLDIAESDEEEGDDEFDESNWRKANPNLGVSVSLEQMREYAQEARLSPDSLGEFKTKRLNVWTSAQHAYLPMDRWRTCEGAFDLDHVAQFPAYAGLDLASKLDIAAFVVTWDIDGILFIWPRLYVPEEIVRPRTERGNVPYQRWVDSGHLIVTPGNITDYSFIEKDIDEAMRRFMIDEIAYDSWNAYDIVNRLTERGAPMVEFVQGPKSYCAPMREMLARVQAGRVRTNGHPVLKWMASNLIARRDANDNPAPDRKNAPDKIDGMTAALMGLGRSMVGDADATTLPADYTVTTA